ncbi:P1 family peptidase [Pseudomonas aeruginosa]
MACASPDRSAKGSVGGGTGMICHEFKGGIGSASRRLPAEQGGWTVGALVQANHGQRRERGSMAIRSAAGWATSPRRSARKAPRAWAPSW